MGQAQWCSCSDRHPPFKEGKAGAASPGEIGRSFRLSDLEQGLFESCSTLEDANEALLEAITLSRSGQYYEAIEKLHVGECLLREAPDTGPADQLRRACCTDPELQVVRQKGLMHSERGSPDSHHIEKKMKSKRKKEKKSPDSKVSGEPEVNTGTILAALEAEIAQVRSFCRSCYILEAQAAWESCVEQAKVAVKQCRKQPDAAKSVAEMSKLLRDDPQFVKLRAIHGRLMRAVPMLRSSDAKGSAPVIITDACLGERFRMEVVVRSCEGAEVEKGGAATQLYVIVRIYNWPTSLVNLAAVDIEADLFKREWTQDCKTRDTYMGGEQSLNSSFAVMSIALKPLPLALEDIMIRESALFSKPPIDGARPGVLIIESGAPVESGKFENWNIPPPPKARGTYRLGNGMKVHYKMSSKDSQDCTDIISISKVDFNIPSWMLPVGTFRNILAKKCAESLKLMKDGMLDNWSQLDYDARIAANKELYGAVQAISETNVM